MGNLVAAIRGELAVCRVTAQVGPVFGFSRGCTGVVRNGAGDYTVTLDQGADFNTEAKAELTLSSALAVHGTVEPVTPTTLRVRTWDAGGVAAEVNFWLSATDYGRS